MEREGESKFYFTVMTCLISYQLGFLCFVISFGQKSLIYYFLIFQFSYCPHSIIPENNSKGLGDILIPLTIDFLGFLIYCLMYFFVPVIGIPWIMSLVSDVNTKIGPNLVNHLAFSHDCEV